VGTAVSFCGVRFFPTAASCRGGQDERRREGAREGAGKESLREG